MKLLIYCLQNECVQEVNIELVPEGSKLFADMHFFDNLKSNLIDSSA